MTSELTNSPIVIKFGDHTAGEGRYLLYAGPVTEAAIGAELKRQRDPGRWALAIQYRGETSYGTKVGVELETGSRVPYPKDGEIYIPRSALD